MNAIVQDTYGTAEVLHAAEIDKPAIAAAEILVQVRAAGISRGTWHLMTGQPYLMRVMGFGLTRPKNPVPGQDVAGVVIEVGSDVTRFQPGDEVFGIGRGAFAEYAVVSQDKLAHKPAGVSFEQAAVAPVSGVTALQALRDKGRVGAGQKVLVIGASGGVGTYAVQLAKSFGAHVTGVSSTGKLDLVQSLGADHVFDYTKADFTTARSRYDLILDNVENRSLSDVRRALKPRGTLVLNSGTGAGGMKMMARLVRPLMLSPFVRQRLRRYLSNPNRADLEVLKAFVEAGQLMPVIDSSFALEKTPAALRHIEAGHARGKVVIAVGAHPQ